MSILEDKIGVLAVVSSCHSERNFVCFKFKNGINIKICCEFICSLYPTTFFSNKIAVNLKD